MKKIDKKKALIFLIVLFVVGLLGILGVNHYVIASTKDRIIADSEIANYEEFDAILVLGAFVKNGSPSPMLEDRLKTGISLYESGSAPKIIVSGDHGKETYDEVNVMKNYMIGSGVESGDIFMDHKGFSTYDSIVRARDVFGVKKVLIVTQEYHLYRSLYIAEKLGLESYGVRAIPTKYRGQLKREIREILARDKDVVKCLFKPTSSTDDEVIPVSGDGDITNDKPSSAYLKETITTSIGQKVFIKNTGIKILQNSNEEYLKTLLEDKTVDIYELIDKMDFIASYDDGGSMLYTSKKDMANELFFLVDCKAIGGNRDIYIGKDKASLINFCTSKE